MGDQRRLRDRLRGVRIHQARWEAASGRPALLLPSDWWRSADGRVSLTQFVRTTGRENSRALPVPEIVPIAGQTVVILVTVVTVPTGDPINNDGDRSRFRRSRRRHR